MRRTLSVVLLLAAALAVPGAAATLTVTPKSAAGARVREQTGLPCGPLVLRVT